MSEQEKPLCACGHDRGQHGWLFRGCKANSGWSDSRCWCTEFTPAVPAAPPAAPHSIPFKPEDSWPPCPRCGNAFAAKDKGCPFCGAAPDSPPAQHNFGTSFPPDDIPDAQCFTLPNGDCVAPEWRGHHNDVCNRKREVSAKLSKLLSYFCPGDATDLLACECEEISGIKHEGCFVCDLAAAEQRIAELEAALRTLLSFASHLKSCQALKREDRGHLGTASGFWEGWAEGDELTCNCGLAAALGKGEK